MCSGCCFVLKLHVAVDDLKHVLNKVVLNYCTCNFCTAKVWRASKFSSCVVWTYIAA